MFLYVFNNQVIIKAYNYNVKFDLVGTLGEIWLLFKFN